MLPDREPAAQGGHQRGAGHERDRIGPERQPAATVKTTPPAGALASCCPAVITAPRRPLARSRRARSRETSAGMIARTAPSNRVAGELAGQQRQGGQVHDVAEGGDRRRRPQLAVLGPQARPSRLWRYPRHGRRLASAPHHVKVKAATQAHHTHDRQ
jgi:hypothetical protein